MLAAFAAAAATTAWPATAQCRLCVVPQTIRTDSAPRDQVRLEVETSVDFDQLIVTGRGDGAATIRPDGSYFTEGPISELGPRTMVGTATVRGEPGRAIRIELPKYIALHSLGGGTLKFDEIVSDLPAGPRLDSAGRLSFRFGGRLHVSGEAGGEYRGDLPITVEYQ